MLPPQATNYAARQFSDMAGVDPATAGQESKLAWNMAQSKKAIQEVRDLLFIGTNAAKDKCEGYSPEQRKSITEDMRFIIADSAERYKASHYGFIEFDVFAEFCVQAVERYGYAHCGELACAVMMNLKNNGVHPLLYCETSEGGHALVVVGIKEGADLHDMTTWGDNAVVCDAWAEKVYPVSEFKEMQESKNDVRYADFWYESESEADATPHYLKGNLVAKCYYTPQNGFLNIKPRQ